VVLVAVAVAGFALTRSASRTEERRLLHERTREVGAVLSTSGTLASSLQLIGAVYTSTGSTAGCGSAFSAAARSLLSGAVALVGIGKMVDGDLVVAAVEGKGLVSVKFSVAHAKRSSAGR
jgi:hypothetical protein